MIFIKFNRSFNLHIENFLIELHFIFIAFVLLLIALLCFWSYSGRYSFFMHSLKVFEFEQTEIWLVLNKKMSFCWKNCNLTFSNKGTQSWYIYYLHSEDGLVWLWHPLVTLYIWLTISSCYGSIPLALELIGRVGGLSTLCHSCGFAYQQRVLKTFSGTGYLCSKDGVVWLWHSLVYIFLFRHC